MTDEHELVDVSEAGIDISVPAVTPPWPYGEADTAHKVSALQRELKMERLERELFGTGHALANADRRAEAAEARVKGLEDEVERLREELRHYAGPKVEANIRRAPREDA